MLHPASRPKGPPACLPAFISVKSVSVVFMYAKGRLRRNGYRVGLVLVGLFAAFWPAFAQTTDWASLIQAAKPAVVWILAETPEGVSAGSGAIISPDGYILTAAHVIEGASRIKVVVEESREFWASVVNADYKVDVAILKIPTSGLTWFALGDSDKVAIEEQIRVLGYPLPGAGVGLIAVAGVIQGTRVLDGVKLLQHNASTASGHSGGPVINAQGEIIGIHSARLTDQPEYRLAVAVNEAKRLIPWGVLPSGPSPVRPAAGPGLPALVIRVPQDQPNLPAAVRAAPEGGEIQVARGTYRGDITITRSIRITGEPGVVIEGIVWVSAARSVTLTNLEIRGALEIRDTASFTLDRVTVKGSPGDGVVIEASSGAVRGCTIEDAQGSGIVVSFGSRVTLVNSAVRRSAKAGISLTLGSQARITGCTIEGNGGDGVYIAASTAELRDNTIQNNQGWGIASGGNATVTPSDLRATNALAANRKGELLGFGPAFFRVTDLSVDPKPPFLVGTTATIAATVTNTGAEKGAKQVWLKVGDARNQEISLALEPGESKRVSFLYAFPKPIYLDVSVCSADECSSPIEVVAKYGVYFEVDKIYISPSPPLPGQPATISARIVNRGLYSGTRTIRCEIDGVPIGETTLSLKPDETRTVTFTHTFPRDGSFAIKIATGDDSYTRTVGVLSPEHIRTLSGHTGSVHSVAFSPDGKILASGSWDWTIKLWDVATGKEIRTLSGHTGSVHSVAFSPDGKILASGSDEIKLWDVTTGTLLRTLQGHTAFVESVAFSPDGKILASGSWDNTIKLWDVATGTLLRTLQGHTYYVYSVAFSPDGKILASGSDDHTIKLWDVATGRELRTLRGHTGGVDSVAFSPDGKILASGSRDRTIKLWDVATGTEIRTLTGHTSYVYSVAFSPDGKVLASGAGGGEILLWDVAAIVGRE
jgi:parallel beta-helix repeat protein